MRFVFGKFVVPEGGAGHIECDGDMGWLLFVDNFEQGIEEPENGGDVFAFRIDHRVADESEVGAIDHRHAVE